MTDDEISELAECLWDACRDYALSCPVASEDSDRCPQSAAFGDWRSHRVDNVFGVVGACAFRCGFDGFRELRPEHLGQQKLFDLGRRFREQALSGEGFK
jgi:hypothetical protein